VFANSPTFRPFRSRNFRLIWAGALVSNIGTWMETVALAALVATRTRSATQVAVASIAGFLPTAFAAPIGSALADRFDRRRFLITTLAMETAFAALLTLLVATGERRTLVLSAVVFCASIVSSAALPNRQSVLPSLVEREDLPAAISLGSASWNGGRVFGPMLATLVTIVGPSWAFAANTLSFLVLLVAWNFVRLPPTPLDQSGASVTTLIRDGLRIVTRDRKLRFAVTLIAVLAGTAGPFIGLLAIMATNVHHGGAAITGLFVSAQGIGAVAGAILATKLSARYGRGRSMMANMIALPILLAIYALAPNPWVAAPVLAAIGATYLGAFTGAQATLQLNSPAEARARVLAVFSVGLGAAYCAALAVGGPLGDRIGIREVTLLQAAATVIGVGWLALRFPRWWDKLESVEF
jgi:MFS family permease